MVAEMLDLLPGERKLVSVEEVDAQLDKGNKEQQVERSHDVGADLRCDLIETKEPGQHDDKERGQANGGVNANDHAESEAPREPARRDAAAHQAQQRTQNVAAAELADGMREHHS